MNIALIAIGLLAEGFVVGLWSFVAGVVEDSDGPAWIAFDAVAWTVGSILLFPITTVWGWIRTGVWIFCHA